MFGIYRPAIHAVMGRMSVFPLFASEVLPRLRPIWDEEGWENHWWPRATETPRAVAGAAAGGEA